MLGTQRDIYRLASAAGNNKMRSTVMLPISGYTDLVACIGILKTEDEKKLDVCLLYTSRYGLIEPEYI